ncbi:hypothetical protein FUA23_13605 [Neolewinella aurantiaca]|uniref:Uncharacterized protein n=1 Tax=Neolewinella aurantiaca TaxID=2602767 RepID=A0A5C7FV11_9BACT|nr:hypothetical protein [Neolewinella aurantiaca]TXF88697.1 hypothetical protein FUA23_13605 [Neolewinella aurantiaca]
MRYLTLLFVFTLAFTSCGEDTAAAEKAATEAAHASQQTAYDAMMAGHDRVMPMMGKITAAQKAITAQLEAPDLDPGKKDLLEATYEQLEDTNDGMMEWMGNLKSLDDLRGSMDNEAIITYIKQEAADIAKVETATNAALGAAAELLGDHAGHSHSDGDDHGHKH